MNRVVESRARRVALFARATLPASAPRRPLTASLGDFLASLLDFTDGPGVRAPLRQPRLLHVALLRAWERSEGRCECRDAGHWHGAERCGRPLTLRMRGLEGWGGWMARARSSGDGCEIVCWACFLFSGVVTRAAEPATPVGELE